MKKNIQQLKIVILEFFYCLSFLLLFFYIMELVWPKIILSYLNLSQVLIFWLIIGIIIVLSDVGNAPKK